MAVIPVRGSRFSFVTHMLNIIILVYLFITDMTNLHIFHISHKII